MEIEIKTPFAFLHEVEFFRYYTRKDKEEIVKDLFDILSTGSEEEYFRICKNCNEYVILTNDMLERLFLRIGVPFGYKVDKFNSNSDVFLVATYIKEGKIDIRVKLLNSEQVHNIISRYDVKKAPDVYLYDLLSLLSLL